MRTPRAACSLACAVVVLALVTAASPSPSPLGPVGLPAPSADDLAASVESGRPAVEVGTPHIEVGVPEIIPFVVERTEADDRVVTLAGDFLFAFGSAVVEPAVVAAIGTTVAAIPQGASVTIGGHTDSVGDDADNQALSEQRAEAVAAVIRQTRPDLTLTVQGFGEAQPVAENEVAGQDNPSGRSLNRRVELRYAS